MTFWCGSGSVIICSGSGCWSRFGSFHQQAKIGKNLDFYKYLTSFLLFIFEDWCKCTFKKQCCRSGSGIGCFSDSRIRYPDPGWQEIQSQDEHPRSVFWFKNSVADPDPRLFSSRPNWDSPTPSPAAECVLSPFGSGGIYGTLTAGEGVVGPNSEEGTDTVVL
jgi:hypothetical protein